MEDKNKIKIIFKVEVVSIISDTNDDQIGEASTGYEFALDTSMPELAYAVAGFLKEVDKDEDMKATVESTLGQAFINLLQLYYDREE